MVYAVDWAAARQKEREACAKVADDLRENMAEVLLAMGEMTAEERRTCTATLRFVAHKIRTRKE